MFGHLFFFRMCIYFTNSMQFFFLPLSYCSCFFLNSFRSGVWASFAGLRDPSLRE